MYRYCLVFQRVEDVLKTEEMLRMQQNTNSEKLILVSYHINSLEISF